MMRKSDEKEVGRPGGLSSCGSSQQAVSPVPASIPDANMLPCNILVTREMLGDAIGVLPKLGAEIAGVSLNNPEVYRIKFWHPEIGGDVSLQFYRGCASFLAKLVPRDSDGGSAEDRDAS